MSNNNSNGFLSTILILVIAALFVLLVAGKADTPEEQKNASFTESVGRGWARLTSDFEKGYNHGQEQNQKEKDDKAKQ